MWHSTFEPERGGHSMEFFRTVRKSSAWYD
jgi:hypothetical protein